MPTRLCGSLTINVVVEGIDLGFNQHCFKKILIINGHRHSSLSPLMIAAMNVKQRAGVFIAVIDKFFLGAKIGESSEDRPWQVVVTEER
jgi:creatinine amidohydrolase